MPLFQVQDSARPLWVVAKDWHHALQQWKDQIAIENDGDSGDPNGIMHVCDGDDLLVYGVLQDDEAGQN